MNEIVGPFSFALVHFLWQGFAIAVALALTLRCVRTANSDLRYLLGVAALALMALMPVLTIAYAVGGDAATERAPASTPLRSSLSSPDIPSVFPELSEEPLIGMGKRVLRSDFVPRGIVALWLIGVLVFTTIHTGGWIEIRRLSRSGMPIDEPQWKRWIAELRVRMGIRRNFAVLTSTRVDVPTLIGAVRPVVLVPASALLGMSPRSLEALLLHELAHIRRHDFLVNLMQAALETLLFYQPAVWWVSRQVRVEREHCCDDLAVRLSGSRRGYVEALVEMERLRTATPRMAVAADGGSLVERIRRLTGTSATNGAGSTRWAMGIGIIVLAFAFATIQLAALPADGERPAPPEPPAPPAAPSAPSAGTPPTPPQIAPAPVVPIAPAVSADASGGTIEGTWLGRVRGDGVQLELRLDGRRNHRSSFWIDADEFSGIGEDGIPGFLLQRDAGTFHFEGRLDGNDEDSRFEFRANPDYAGRMRSIGFDDAPTSAKRLYSLAALDVSFAFAEGIRDAGYGDISIERLTEFRIHGVTPEFVRAMAETGFEDLSPGRLVEFRIHGVSPEFVKAMAESGLEGLSASRLVEFRIHGVSPEFVEAMAASGFEDLSPSRLVEFRIHGVSPEFVRGMADAGLEDLSANRLVEFRIHGVSPEFVRELSDLGLDGLSASRLVEFRIHGVSPEFVRTARAEYGEDLTARDLIELRIHGRRDEY